ncbi:MAG: DinB family protein [Gemmatimonadota bacterium]
MFTRLESFLGAWTYEAASTQRILDALTDESLEQAVAPGHRTVRRLAWHIAQTLPEMMGKTGLAVSGLGEHDPPPATAQEIAEAYKTAASSLEKELRANWTDATLGEKDDMYGFQWTRGETLGVLLIHQAHHRGQLTVLMRQAGLVVPGIVGPNKEDWAQWGMQPPEV